MTTREQLHRALDAAMDGAEPEVDGWTYNYNRTARWKPGKKQSWINGRWQNVTSWRM